MKDVISEKQTENVIVIKDTYSWHMAESETEFYFWKFKKMQ